MFWIRGLGQAHSGLSVPFLCTFPLWLGMSSFPVLICCLSSLVRCLLSFFPHILIGLFALLLLNFKGCFYIQISDLCLIFLLQIFNPSLVLVISFFDNVYIEQILKIFFEVQINQFLLS